MKSSSSLCFFTVLLVVSLIPAHEVSAAKFAGQVIDENGQPLADVRVSLYSENVTHLSVSTDERGAWQIDSADESAKTIVYAREGYCYEQNVNQLPSLKVAITLRKQLLSHASSREQGYLHSDCGSVDIPDDPQWNAKFRIRPLKGDLAPNKKFTRRDPSAVIKVKDTYYVWYSYSLTHDKARIAPWDLNDLYYATSKDGITWKERGLAVGRGNAGSFDHRSVFTTEILAHAGKYYLVYQAAGDEDGVYNRNTVAMSVADSPDGPWTKLKSPVLTPTYTEDMFFDNNAVHDPCIVPYQGKFYLYYKGECNCRGDEDCQRWCNPICGLKKQVKWGVAIGSSPTGPYQKSTSNPVTNTGHEVMVWPYRDGIAILQHQDGPEPNSIQYSSDGLNFDIKGTVKGIPEAAGLYRGAKSDDDPHAGIQWGLGHQLKWNAGPKGWMYIYRFDLVK